ncbi:IstB-like ATP binding protein [Kribbella pratensis]|uniref:IstB-like ATP binding protein n=1 Tax=Kribbella pratensis TaxID=2512112 RepID=A0ABY2FH31_9ACTN|nr:IstB-like ATP binding protein [Kribbella pratensis]
MATRASSPGKTSTVTKTERDLSSELAFLTRALKAPTLREAVPRWPNAPGPSRGRMRNSLPPCLQREVSARESHGGEGRIRAARFPARKSLEEFDFDHARGLKRDIIAHLGTLDFITGKDNVVFLGPPGTGKTHLATGIAIRACQAGHRVLFATAAEWVDRLAEAHTAGRLQDELRRLGRYPLLVIDEVGYIPLRARSREPVPPARLIPLRTSIPDRDQQQRVRPLGRSLRRRHRRRRDDRPTRPPRRRHRPQRRLLPPQEPQPRPDPHTDRRPTMTTSRGFTFNRRKGVRFQPSLTWLRAVHRQATNLDSVARGEGPALLDTWWQGFSRRDLHPYTGRFWRTVPPRCAQLISNLLHLQQTKLAEWHPAPVPVRAKASVCGPVASSAERLNPAQPPTALPLS